MQKANISGKSPAISAVVYDKLKGVDFSTDPGLIDASRSPYAPNLMSGPGGYPEKRPGWRTLKQLEAPIYGIHSGLKDGKMIYLIHSGTKLYEWLPESGDTMTPVWSDMPESYSRSFVHQNRIYILTGKTFLCAGDVKDGAWGVRPVSEIAKIPTVLITSSPHDEDGVPLEDRNLLTNYRTVGYVGRGKNYTDAPNLYKLPFENLPSGTVKIRVKNQETLEWEDYTEIPESYKTIKINSYTYRPSYTIEDVEGEEHKYYYDYPKYNGYWWSVYVDYNHEEAYPKTFVVNRTQGLVAFAVPPWDNSAAGADNVEISVEVVPEDEADKDGVDTINKCDTFSVFEERIWVTGNPDKKAFDWHSDVDDPTYFPDTGYTRVGNAGTEIMGYLQVGTAQAIVKDEGNQDASVYLRTAGTLNDLAAFPIKQGVAGQGAVSKRAFANILDDPMFLTRNGVFAISSNIVTEQRTMVNRSRFLDPRLTQEQNLKNAVACSWNGMYLLSMTDGTVYLLDGKQDKVYLENSLTGAGYNYEAYHWTNVPATVWMPQGKDLYFGTSDGRICKMNTDIEGVAKYNDDGAAVYAARATRVEFCGDFLRYKTMVKKGSGLLMQPYSRSSAKVFVRTDRAAAQEFFVTALDDDDWNEGLLNSDYAGWEGAKVVPFKKKVKKWKWIQMIVENKEVNEGFGIYGIILRHQKQNLV